MAANGYPLTLHVLCGNCQTVVGAPLGHPIVRCGNCSCLLRVGGAVRLAAEQRMAPAVQQYMQQQQASATQRQNRSKEASAKAIASLRRFTATKEWIAEKGGPECVITAEDFKAGDPVIEMPCHHVFQPQALEHWLAQNHTCPICRHEIEPAFPETGSQWDTSTQAGHSQNAAAGPPGVGSQGFQPDTSSFQPQTREQEEQGFLQANDGTIVLTGRAMTGGNRSTRSGGGGGCTVM